MYFYLGLKQVQLVLLCKGQVVTEEKIQEAKLFYQMHFKHQVFDEEGWRKVLEVWKDILPVCLDLKVYY